MVIVVTPLAIYTVNLQEITTSSKEFPNNSPEVFFSGPGKLLGNLLKNF